MQRNKLEDLIYEKKEKNNYLNSKSKIKMNFKCKRTTDVRYSKKILEILNITLLTPDNYEKFSEEEKNKSKNTGFVIGKHDLKTLEEWISNDENIVIVTTININNKEELIGYLITLQTKEIQEEVKDYLKNMINLDENLKKYLDEEFAYLIQIALDYKYINNGIGTSMFNELKRHLERTAVSYVMKKPILNEISLYAHLKSGFLYFGDYIGDYDEFKDYQSVGLMLPKSNINSKIRIEKNIILDRMKKASHIFLK